MLEITWKRGKEIFGNISLIKYIKKEGVVLNVVVMGPHLFTAMALIENDTHDMHPVHRPIRGSIVDVVVFLCPRDGGGIWGHNRRIIICTYVMERRLTFVR
jgi:hypothetical protein